MAEVRRSDALGNMEPKNVKNYKRKTKRMCDVCSGENPLYIKHELDNAIHLECPICDNTVVVPKGAEDTP